ncbi:TPA: hypothetical protein QDB04_000117 [Burkholderia vietnamiensis]|nr:hypothetical protein [Burkholderia vietnamiensis]
MKREITTYTGVEARQEFEDNLWQAASAATGGVFGYQWQATPDGKGTHPVLVRFDPSTFRSARDADSPLSDRKLIGHYTMVVIDLGDDDDRHWKFIYFPDQQMAAYHYEG